MYSIYLYQHKTQVFIRVYNRYALGAWGARISGVMGPTHLLRKEERSSDVIRGTDRKGPGEVRLRKPRPSNDRKGTRGFKCRPSHLATPILEPASNLHVLVVMEFCAK